MKLNGRELDLSRPQVMTIVNVTDDSFYEGSRTSGAEAIERRVASALEQGAAIFDVGGYSSRSGADDIPPEEEWRRVERGLAAVRRIAGDIPVSVDTFRAEVARRAIENFGELIINDISAGELDPEIVTWRRDTTRPISPCTCAARRKPCRRSRRTSAIS